VPVEGPFYFDTFKGLGMIDPEAPQRPGKNITLIDSKFNKIFFLFTL